MIKSITLYHKGCYACHDGFDTLRSYIIRERLQLDVLTLKRIETNPEWQEEAATAGIDLPFLSIETEDGIENIKYSEWEEKAKAEMEEQKPKRKAHRKVKTTAIKEDETINQSEIPNEE